MSSDDSVWVYHERQSAMMCGKHALNNLAQQGPNAFPTPLLVEIAYELDQLERSVLTDPSSSSNGGVTLHQPSANVDASGNFSIQVLKRALQDRYGITLSHLSVLLAEASASATTGRRPKNAAGDDDVTTFQGFLCHKSNPDHWFAIRQVGGRFWNLNSTLERPIAVSHFSIGTEVTNWQNQGYNVYGIRSGLPAGGVKFNAPPPPTYGGASTAGNWHTMSDLLRGRSTVPDPWESLTGKGMRLDGGGKGGGPTSTASTSRATSGGSYGDVMGGGGDFDFDDELQRALQASLETATAEEEVASWTRRAVPPEPPSGAKNAVRVQVKLPGGARVVRRFSESDPVEVLFAFVHQRESGGGGGGSSSSHPQRVLELRYGFPPKDLREHMSQTLGQAKLNGVTIQGRYV